MDRKIGDKEMKRDGKTLLILCFSIYTQKLVIIDLFRTEGENIIFLLCFAMKNQRLDWIRETFINFFFKYSDWEGQNSRIPFGLAFDEKNKKIKKSYK